MATYLFVYGTLMHDQPAYYRLEAGVVGRTNALLPQADLFAAGWYPLAADGQGRVRGDLLEIQERTWSALAAQLDDYEGDEYRRLRRTVLAGGGETPIPAWVYLADPAVARHYWRIVDGDWRAYLAREEQPGGGR